MKEVLHVTIILEGSINTELSLTLQSTDEIGDRMCFDLIRAFKDKEPELKIASDDFEYKITLTSVAKVTIRRENGYVLEVTPYNARAYHKENTHRQ